MDSTIDSPISLASYKRDKQFKLYTPVDHDDRDSWRFTVYGDDLGTVDTSLKLKWIVESGDREADANFRRFAELAEYLEKEVLFTD